ncbi:MAG TPA: thioredoxin-dependent thiol peroxidase [Phnomibacter sp.]|nr:thioredoxin-dependent thiol peroxidase [Phnomibacter sp.]
MTTLKKGDKAPAFAGLDQHGNEVSLKDFKGKKLVIYFYPKDNTPTCTVQACNLRDNFSALKKAGIQVVGVSMDSVKSHGKFAQKFDLPFSLLADEDRKILEAYGVWGEKKFMGRVYDGIHRTSFLIDEKGKIKAIITKPVSKNHTQEILDAWAQ